MKQPNKPDREWLPRIGLNIHAFSRIDVSMQSDDQALGRLSTSVRIGILFFSLPMCFRTFQFFPGFAAVQEIWFVLIAFLLLAVYLPWRWHRGKLMGFEAYLFLTLILIPLLSAVASAREFGQPLAYSVLAQRGIILVAGTPLLMKMLVDRGVFHLQDIRQSLLALAWFTLFLFIFMALFLDPASFFDVYGAGFVSGSDPDAKFAFDTIFISFGFYFYAFRGMKRKSGRDHLFACLFFLFLLIIIRGRSLLLSILGTYFIFIILWAPNKQKLIKFLPKVILIFGLIISSIYIFKHDLYTILIGKFSDAFTVVFTGEPTDDASANSRIQQTLMAIPYILKNWHIGNGVVSNQWEGGFKSIMGYFHPSDIGIIGVLFLYGAIGTLIYLVQFWFAYKFSNRDNPTTATNDFTRGIKGLILSQAIGSLATGGFVHHAEVSLFAIAVLWLNAQHPTSNPRSTRPNPLH